MRLVAAAAGWKNLELYLAIGETLLHSSSTCWWLVAGSKQASGQYLLVGQVTAADHNKPQTTQPAQTHWPSLWRQRVALLLDIHFGLKLSDGRVWGWWKPLAGLCLCWGIIKHSFIYSFWFKIVTNIWFSHVVEWSHKYIWKDDLKQVAVLLFVYCIVLSYKIALFLNLLCFNLWN